MNDANERRQQQIIMDAYTAGGVEQVAIQFAAPLPLAAAYVDFAARYLADSPAVSVNRVSVARRIVAAVKR